MNNIMAGIFSIVFCAIGYYYSWKFQKKDDYRIAILLLIICGLALRMFISADLFLHAWDERYHALVAKNLIQHPLIPTLYNNPVLPYDYKSWIANHIWLHKQPLPLWGMAASMALFGVNEIALRLPSIILSVTGIYLIFIIGRYFSNKQTGYLAAFFFSINGLIIELTGGRVATDHIDIYFLFFVELAVVFSIFFVIKRKMVFNILVGISIGAAILTKWLPALIVLPIWLLLVLDSGKFKPKEIVIQFLIICSTAVIIFLPWQIYVYQVFPLEAKWEAGFNVKHMTETLEGRTGPFYYFVNQIRINYGEIIYLPLLWFLWKTYKNLNDKKRLAISIWFLIPFLFFSFAKTKMQAYILFASPALFIMTAEFWVMLAAYGENYKFKWVINILLVLIILLPVRYSIERLKPFDKMERNPAWVTDLKTLNKRNIQNGLLFNYPNPIEAMFYTDLTVYQSIPEIEILNTLKQNGFKILINKGENIPVDIKTSPLFEIVELKSADK